MVLSISTNGTMEYPTRASQLNTAGSSTQERITNSLEPAAVGIEVEGLFGGKRGVVVGRAWLALDEGLDGP